MRRRTRAIQQFEQVLDASMTGAPSELTLLARSALHEIGEDQPVMRIVVKEGENFPGLRDEFRERIVRRGHLKTVQWLELASSRARVKGLDLDAIAAVMLGSLINYRVLDTPVRQAAGGRRRGALHRGLDRLAAQAARGVRPDCRRTTQEAVP